MNVRALPLLLKPEREKVELCLLHQNEPTKIVIYSSDHIHVQIEPFVAMKSLREVK